VIPPSWLDEAVPPVPGELAGWLRFEGDTGRPDVDAFARAAEAALNRALDGGREREAAFHLLAADGLLTRACREALRSGSRRDVLESLARRVASLGAGRVNEGRDDAL
jgi:hypothetical protein